MTNQPWSVTELTLRAKKALEKELAFVWVQGEISNLMQPKSGHLYFTIKDHAAQISCVWLKYNHSGNVKNIANGKQWWFKGKISIYQERGTFQLVVSYAEEFGLGAKQLLIEQKKQELKNKGWLEQYHKKPLPQFAKEIALVTSASGAAVQDMIKVIRKRMPATKILIVPCQVQGQNAAQSIATAIRLANQHTNADLLIVGRGGGSIEDLWAYNEDEVVNAIFNSNKPIVTGIGHETDNTLAELVADLRAATPSAAAELATQDQAELIQKLDSYLIRLNSMLANTHKKHQLQLKLLNSKCLSPNQQLKLKASEIMHSRELLIKNLSRTLNNNSKEVLVLERRFLQAKPNTDRLNEQVHNAKAAIDGLIQLNFNKKLTQISNDCQQLNALNPLNLVAKGYAIVRKEDNSLLDNKTQAKINDILLIETANTNYKAKIIDQNSKS